MPSIDRRQYLSDSDKTRLTTLHITYTLRLEIRYAYQDEPGVIELLVYQDGDRATYVVSADGYFDTLVYPGLASIDEIANDYGNEPGVCALTNTEAGALIAMD